jgi:hypothetical protein
MKDVIEQFANTIRPAAEQHRPLRIGGAGSEDFLAGS